MYYVSTTKLKNSRLHKTYMPIHKSDINIHISAQIEPRYASYLIIDVKRCFPSIHVRFSSPSSVMVTAEVLIRGASGNHKNLLPHTKNDGRDIEVTQYRVYQAGLFLVRPHNIWKSSGQYWGSWKKCANMFEVKSWIWISPVAPNSKTIEWYCKAS